MFQTKKFSTCYFGCLTAADCKSALNKNRRIGIAVEGFKSLGNHRTR